MRLDRAALRDPDLWSGLRQGVMAGAAVLVLTVPPMGLATSRLDVRAEAPATRVAAPAALAAIAPAPRSAVAAPDRIADFGDHEASLDARLVVAWVTRARDNGGAPFVILDKRDARVFVFDRDARLVGASPVLLGAAAGDDSAAGIGTRPIAEVRPDERTTPAGRFVSRPGRNAGGEDVVWIDYDAAVSMHRVRPVDPAERRLERLASPDPAQRRISYGCINVPLAFFESVVRPAVGTQPAVVYVLPETKDVHEVFGRIQAAASASRTT